MTVPLVVAARRVAMDTSFIVPHCCPAPPTFLGTISQAHLLLMSLMAMSSLICIGTSHGVVLVFGEEIHCNLL